MTTPTPNTSLEKATRPLRIVKIGSEGIAIKPDTGDLKTDMQTVAMCGLDEKLALMFAAAPDMLAALKAAKELLLEIERLGVDGGLVSDNPDTLLLITVAIAKAGGQ